MSELTVVLIKPDAVRRNLIGPILDELERQQPVEILELQMMHFSHRGASRFYARQHAGKSYYPQLSMFLSSGPCVFLLLKGPEIIRRIREKVGPANQDERQTGQIRHTFATGFPIMENVVHASDSAENAEYELEAVRKALGVHP